MLTSLLLAIVLPLYTFAAGFVGIPYTLVTGDSRPLYWLGRLGVRIGFLLARIRIVVHGRDVLPEKPHFIYMMNHNSNLDAPAVWLNLTGEVRALGKQELFKLPVLATAMRLGGFVPVDRSNRESAIASVKNAAALAADGASFLIAPEGTRSRTGKLLRFKKGGFHMAVESRVPILPITVIGAYELMPPGSLAIRSGTIEIFFHDPIEIEGDGASGRIQLMERVREPMEATCPVSATAPLDDRRPVDHSFQVPRFGPFLTMSGARETPMSGRLGSQAVPADVPELLHAVSESGKTGRLMLEDDGVEKQIFVSHGQIVFAASSLPDDRLGAYLLQRDQLALDDLMTLSPKVRPGVRLGTLLVQHGVMRSSELSRAVDGQIKAIVLSLFGWTRPAYAFVEEPATPTESIQLTTPTARLIVDGIDTVPSWPRIAKGLGSLEERFVIGGGNLESMRSADLDTSSLELLAMLRHPKTVRELCEQSDMPDIAVCRKLWAFRVLDWVRPAGEVDELDLDLEGLGMIFGGDEAS